MYVVCDDGLYPDVIRSITSSLMTNNLKYLTACITFQLSVSNHYFFYCSSHRRSCYTRQRQRNICSKLFSQLATQLILCLRYVSSFSQNKNKLIVCRFLLCCDWFFVHNCDLFRASTRSSCRPVYGRDGVAGFLCHSTSFCEFLLIFDDEE